MSKFLVTGGAGFIGGWVVAALLERGHEIVVVDDLSTGKKSNLDLENKKLRLIEGDFADRSLLKNELRGKDGILHLAAYIDLAGSFEDLEKCCELNVSKTATLLRAAVEAKVGRFVFASSAAAVAPNSPYGSSKLFIEQILEQFSKQYGLNAACLRFFNVFGSKQSIDSKYAAVIPRFITQALKEAPLTIYGNGEQRRDFIHVSDVALANAVAAETVTGFRRIDVGHGRSYSILDLVDALEKVFGRKLKTAQHPRPSADADDSVAELGPFSQDWSPRTDFITGLREVVDWYRQK